MIDTPCFFLEEIEEKVKNKEIELKEIGKVLTLST